MEAQWYRSVIIILLTRVRPSSNNFCSGDVYFNEFVNMKIVHWDVWQKKPKPNSNAIEDDGSCVVLGGCNDMNADNYSTCVDAIFYNEQCVYLGCTDPLALTLTTQLQMMMVHVFLLTSIMIVLVIVIMI